MEVPRLYLESLFNLLTPCCSFGRINRHEFWEIHFTNNQMISTSAFLYKVYLHASENVQFIHKMLLTTGLLIQNDQQCNSDFHFNEKERKEIINPMVTLRSTNHNTVYPYLPKAE